MSRERSRFMSGRFRTKVASGVSPAGVLEGTLTWMVMDAIGGWVCAPRGRATTLRITRMTVLIGLSEIRIVDVRVSGRQTR